ncbi:hypothetical protein CH373_17220 [Leptospira perolatii]|uniref:Lipoprotein n=1 Tax=Leptospira perolatii TaxID=2023191 RepID=A0A2M9ZIH4_9LEPT|nr:hypothetical protein [Leptospira perolatii]PJZ68535.1 hypothetical protein CH360_15680 [Leptospira perolatii]PJZ71865.1 hypothetical protein CH373_17220 [Leptospira perolatii]
MKSIFKISAVYVTIVFALSGCVEKDKAKDQDLLLGLLLLNQSRSGAASVPANGCADPSVPILNVNGGPTSTQVAAPNTLYFFKYTSTGAGDETISLDVLSGDQDLLVGFINLDLTGNSPTSFVELVSTNTGDDSLSGVSTSGGSFRCVIVAGFTAGSFTLQVTE